MFARRVLELRTPLYWSAHGRKFLMGLASNEDHLRLIASEYRVEPSRRKCWVM